ncbi:PAS domain S-box-containing protein [Flavobacterium chryseum]|uniref:sensor histidine kinase n=1 Tax=Flavobacterium sp. P3160 TaxID=2512113 RepID=UPI0010D0AA12|nr:PAS domain S-box protein [Flavobacterium sp. P3160]TDO71153.1 PAS domain S-box-containing protein [Flavobacterium sp. P3160]
MNNENKLQSFTTEQRYHRMVDEVQDYAILLLDTNGDIQNWNKGAQKIKGYTEEEILGKNFSIFYLPNDIKEELPFRLIREAATHGKAAHEGWRVRKDGTAFWGNVVITALHDDENNVIGFTKVTRDLTERKLAEEQKERDAQSIEIQNKQLEEFAYVTSHDLQEPIRKIRTFINLAKKNLADVESVGSYLEKIDASAEKMVRLIKDVLTFSRLSHDHSEFTEVDLNIIIQNVLADSELTIAEKSAVIEVTQLPTVKGIPVQLHQLFTNLLSNTLKFNYGIPKISITATTIVESEAGAKTYSAHILSVIDNGIGFDQKYADQAFQPFRRLSTEFEGTGIGLSLCRRIVENHKGSIHVHSEPGKGCIFKIKLPAYN